MLIFRTFTLLLFVAFINSATYSQSNPAPYSNHSESNPAQYSNHSQSNPVDYSNHSESNPAQYVNPFIGTGGHGHTFPGATVPFGMVQLSPDTRLEGWDGCGGYHYSDEHIYGFSHTHLSGTGIPDYGDVLLMPFTGEEHWNNGYDGMPGYRSSFSHDKETATPGYYGVRLLDHEIDVRLTTTARAGFHSYHYLVGDTAKILIDLAHRDEVIDSWITKVSDYELEGFRRSSAWAVDQRVYFVLRFSEKISGLKLSDGNKVLTNVSELKGKNIKAILTFGPSPTLLVKAGISAVSSENARLNLDTEIDGWDFNKVRNDALNLWNKELSKIQVKSTDNDKLAVFYTALYHAMVSPNVYNDVDGSYLGRDFNVHKTNHDYYTVFSLWDTYRALHPLMTIIDQKRTNDFIKTFLRQFSEGGLLPVWELSANETYCMIGYHAIPVIADAFIKGIRDYDTELAFKAMLESARRDHFGLKYYKKYGFIPADSDHESVSKTLEYAYDDWCIGTMAKEMGYQALSDSFLVRAQGYKHLYDHKSGFMRARFNGAWFNPFDPREVNFNYTEANSWQYSFYVPHDMDHFTSLHGGKQGLEAKLDGLFQAPTQTTGREQSDITGLIGQYAHGNEPSHHIAYLYNFAGNPAKTQEKVHYIMENFYTNSPDGLIGNEDCGQMSAWAVFSSLGFYPVCPGTDQYIIGKPHFEETIINLENGKQFIVKATNLTSKNIYIQSVMLNGRAYNKSYISHHDIMDGGTMLFVMGDSPSESWGKGQGNEPTTSINSDKIIAAPVIDRGDYVFDEQTTVNISSNEKAEIRYTLNGTPPDLTSPIFINPITVKESTTFRFRGYKDGYLSSEAVSAVFTKRPQGISLKLNTNYAPQYSGNGENTLLDGLKGNEDFRLGGWQGYQGVDIEADIIISDDKRVKAVSISFLQDINAWIFMPERIELWTSSDGIDYKLKGSVVNDVPQDKWGTIIKEYTINVDGSSDKYLRLKAINIRQCPDTHKGRGYPAWIFADEITVGFQ